MQNAPVLLIANETPLDDLMNDEAFKELLLKKMESTETITLQN